MKSYNFEVLVDDINDNKERAIQRDRENSIKEKQRVKRYKLRRWVKIMLWTLFVAFTTLSLYQLATVKNIKSTPVGNYTCHGKLVQICSGSKEVVDYLGV